jgi:predicted GNAT family acetyltransferase
MTDVTDNRPASRFELTVDGHTAIAAYDRAGDRITFTHTIVPRELEGRGIGSRLIAAALASVQAEGLKVIPQCSFVAAYLKKHPEAATLA